MNCTAKGFSVVTPTSPSLFIKIITVDHPHVNVIGQ